MALFVRNHAIVVDVKTKGAKGDGKTDDGPAIMDAWKEACAAAPPSSVFIPPGTYMAFPLIQLYGPCKGPIEIKATGATIKAPSDLAMFKNDSWIVIAFVDQLTMTGGTFDGQGQESWRNNKCNNCPKPANLRFGYVKNSLIKDLTSINSKMFHIAVLGSDNTTLEHITIDAPRNSVNTDGIHLGRLNGLNIKNSNIKTGDDCISFGDGSKNVHVEKVTCGPGHGISIGSLGRYPNEEPVQGIWIKNCTITGTDNGVRIKSWPASFPGTVNDVHFEDIVMDKVANPIIIDQNYCPGHACKRGGGPAKTGGPSKVKITNVSFRRIKGTSSTQVALKLNCSAVSPCDSVELGDINLTYNGVGQANATSKCFNVKPKVVGQIVPPACPDAPQHRIV
ncbi:glycoside hydrolase, family 28, Pectin lyase fold/virulence factor [Artemisia annua]|uniref:Glycoside hydrolase, family 28, Pectin lyase fold/virulence factor n=1 Tax=Artemisia annua TaxID=35608 RepID=A0A2U1PHV3_ARTAN|nr:glycoside hydrolase, family 28, Pectin lyase fold/virulence factor [Artemisia annua]